MSVVGNGGFRHEIESGGETDGQTHKREKAGDRQTERERDRQTERRRETEAERNRETDRRQVERHTDADGQTRETYRQTKR